MGDERAFVAALAARFRASPRRVPVGIGDDAAVVRFGRDGTEIAMACDPVVEGVHFESSTPGRAVGRKAVNRNLSDLAAMGARPVALLVSLLVPRGFSARRRTAVLDGIEAAAADAGCVVVGGDTGTTTGPPSVTVTALGERVGERWLLRSTARVGDTLHVTGPLGGAWGRPGERRRRRRHLDFVPRLPEGAWLADRAAAQVGACIDVSDGLVLDLHAVLEASGGLGAELDADAVPVHADAGGPGPAALDAALGDGEDHELLFTVRRGASLPAGGPLASVARTAIGRVRRRPGIDLLTGGQRRVVTRGRAAPRLGWRHEL